MSQGRQELVPGKSWLTGREGSDHTQCKRRIARCCSRPQTSTHRGLGAPSAPSFGFVPTHPVPQRVPCEMGDLTEVMLLWSPAFPGDSGTRWCRLQHGSIWRVRRQSINSTRCWTVSRTYCTCILGKLMALRRNKTLRIKLAFRPQPTLWTAPKSLSPCARKIPRSPSAFSRNFPQPLEKQMLENDLT